MQACLLQGFTLDLLAAHGCASCSANMFDTMLWNSMYHLPNRAAQHGSAECTAIAQCRPLVWHVREQHKVHVPEALHVSEGILQHHSCCACQAHLCLSSNLSMCHRYTPSGFGLSRTKILSVNGRSPTVFSYSWCKAWQQGSALAQRIHRFAATATYGCATLPKG